MTSPHAAAIARRARAQRALKTADLRELGVSKGELRGPRWRAPFLGVHTPECGDADPVLQRILDAAELVPSGGAIGGWAAAWLLGAWELDGRGRSGRECEPVLILVPQNVTPAERPGLRFFRSRLDDGDTVDLRGLPVTSGVRTTFDLARLSNPEDALVAGDVMARALGIDAAKVLRYADHHPRFRGVPVARCALALVDPRARSTGESRFRWLWLTEAGLPVPQCNPYVLDDGVVVASPDLLDVATGLVGEYDGESHRALAEHTYDNAREEDLEGMGLVVVRATSLDLSVFRARTVKRLLHGQRRAAATSTRSWGWRPGRVVTTRRSQPISW